MSEVHVDPSALILPGVEFGHGVVVEAFCVIGASPRGKRDGRRTIIGDRAHIRSHSVIYCGNTIGAGFETGNGVNVREGNQIGDNVSVGTHSVIEHSVVIEDDVRIHSNVFIPEFTKLRRGAWIGPNVVLTNAKFPAETDTKRHLLGPEVAEGARIGANVTVLPGLRLGRDCLVGAGSVVTRHVPDGMLAAGNPARILRPITRTNYSV
jgi:acetyltransferase-like isoleucine patch superfamily enzyme